MNESNKSKICVKVAEAIGNRSLTGKSTLSKESPSHDTFLQIDLVKQHFSNAKGYASIYDGVGPDAYFFLMRINRVLQLIGDFPYEKVLDVGCGPGA
jgi:2-polyprenyl-3-methyl-5-hydroxy-6-metoxy-1,4-benzoquinol methylase